MFADLSACGGILTMAAGFRVSKIKSVPLVDLMPALILVMPFSALWSSLMQQISYHHTTDHLLGIALCGAAEKVVCIAIVCWVFFR